MIRTDRLRTGWSRIIPYTVAIVAILLLGSDTFPPTGEPLPLGEHQAEEALFTLPEDARVVEADGAALGQAVRTQSIGFTISSQYDLWVRWRSESPLPDDANRLFTTLDDDGWLLTRMPAREFFPTGHTVPTQFGDEETPPFLIDSLTVVDRTYERLYPLIVGVGLAVGLLVWVVFRALRERPGRS